jgi:hypothetical protein
MGAKLNLTTTQLGHDAFQRSQPLSFSLADRFDYYKHPAETHTKLLFGFFLSVVAVAHFLRFIR